MEWIIVATWVVCGLVAIPIMWRGWTIEFNGKYKWARTVESVAVFIIGPFGLGLAIILVGKNCFKKGNEMKIHWDENKQQIVTKDGKCIYDKAAIMTYYTSASLITDCRTGLHKETQPLLRQLQCAAKGHGKWGFAGGERDAFKYHSFIFKCSDCGLVITKTEKELKPAEKEALKKLNLF